MNIIILADRYKKGMKSKGCVGLLQYNKKENIFQKQYKEIKLHNSDHKIVYVIGFESKKFLNFLKKSTVDYDIDLIDNKLYPNRNAGFSLYLIKEFLSDNCLIIDGNIIISSSILDDITKNNESKVFIGSKNSNIGCIISNHMIDTLNIDLDNKIYDAYYLNKQASESLANMLNANYFNSFLFELINKVIDSGHQFSCIKIKKKQLCYQ